MYLSQSDIQCIVLINNSYLNPNVDIINNIIKKVEIGHTRMFSYYNSYLLKCLAIIFYLFYIEVYSSLFFSLQSIHICVQHKLHKTTPIHNIIIMNIGIDPTLNVNIENSIIPTVK